MESYVDRVKTLAGLLNLREETYVDMAFQRRACWDSETERKFLRSFSRGKCFNPVIVADIDKCIQFCKDEGEPYHKLAMIKDKGKRFISLDGQNRLNTLAKFFNNGVSLTGIFKDDNGRSIRVNNAFYKDMPGSLQRAFQQSKLLVLFEENSTYEEFYETFISVNGGLPLNRMELRNPMPTPLAEWIRALGDEFEESITEQIKGLKTERMDDYEILLKLVCLTHSEQSELAFASDNLDAFYAKGNNKLDFDLVYGEGFQARGESLLGFISNVISGAGRKITKQELWAIAHSYNFYAPLLDSCEAEVVTWSQVFEDILEAHDMCCQNSASQYAADTARWKRSKSSVVTKAPAVSGYYFQRIKVIDNASHRSDVIENLCDSLATAEVQLPLNSPAANLSGGTPLTAEEIIRALGTDDLVSLIESSEVVREYFLSKAGGLS